MLGAGDHVPDVRAWAAPEAAVSLRALAAEAPYLLLFYLLDWTST
jgi:hypothetical protein